MKTPITPRLVGAIKEKAIRIVETGYDAEKTQILKAALRDLMLASIKDEIEADNLFIKQWLFEVEQNIKDTNHVSSTLWRDLRQFYIDAGFARPYDKTHFPLSRTCRMGGKSSLIWFVLENNEYTFNSCL